MLLMSIIIILNIYLFSFAAESFDCTDGTVQLKLNEIAFFETQNFPNFLSAKLQDQCDLKFLLSNYENTSYQMILGYYQFPQTFKKFPSMFSINNTFSYLLRSSFPEDRNPIAEQGFIVFVEELEECPMEFLSKDKPFEILTENQILYLRSSYFNKQIRQKTCKWRFFAPDGFGFKIVLQTLNISATTFLRIENTTDIIANEKSVRINYPYYNSDNLVQITLTKGDPNFNITDIEFQAYLSIVKRTQEKRNASCRVRNDKDVITWTNMNVTKGCKISTQCIYELIVPPNTAVYVTMSAELEDYIDYIKYYNKNNQTKNDGRIVDYKNSPSFVLGTFKNDSEEYVLFEFVSDGSVPFSGFQIVFQFIFCQCTSYKIATCGSSYNRLMDIHGPSIDTAYYCGNLKCNITIEKCSTALTYIEFFTDNNVSTNDIFKIISDNQTIFQIIDWKQNSHFTYLNSSSENIFVAVTSFSSKINSLYFRVKEFEVPPESNFIFSEDNYTAIFGTAENPFTVHGLILGQNCPVQAALQN